MDLNLSALSKSIHLTHIQLISLINICSKSSVKTAWAIIMTQAVLSMMRENTNQIYESNVKNVKDLNDENEIIMMLKMLNNNSIH